MGLELNLDNILKLKLRAKLFFHLLTVIIYHFIIQTSVGS